MIPAQFLIPLIAWVVVFCVLVMRFKEVARDTRKIKARHARRRRKFAKEYSSLLDAFAETDHV